MLTVGVPIGEVADVDVEAKEMMSGGIVDVEPSLIIRNTLGNGNRNSKSQTNWVRMAEIYGGGLGKDAKMKK